MKNLLISGISGMVGKNILSLAPIYNFNVICGIDKKRFTSADCAIYTDFSEVKERIDMIIDFSSSSLFDSLLNFAINQNCPLLTGTTGLTCAQEDNIKIASLNIPICHSNNFSNGIRSFKNACKNLKESLEEFDIYMTEIHNRNKQDCPGGTAKFIANELSLQKVISIRGGNTAGVHKMLFLGEGEEIEISHRVYDKSVFARGALICAKNLLNKEKGFYKAEELFAI